MEMIVERLMYMQHRSSTARMYLNIWRNFNKFLLKLDKKPDKWEHRTTLFMAYLIDKGCQSATIKSYVSAIKKTLVMDKYPWQDSEILGTSLTCACRLVNDRVHNRFPIQCGLLEMLLFEIECLYGGSQPYLEILYKAIYIISYYGLMRVREVTCSPHVLLAQNIHLAQNKNKILIVLYSSKMHNKESRPQKIKIVSNKDEKSGHYTHRMFCPFMVLKHFIDERGGFDDDQEQLFIFKDKQPVKPFHVTTLLKKLIVSLGLNPCNYGMHSFRIGRTTDLIKFGYSIDEVRRLGRWRSSVVYKYIT